MCSIPALGVTDVDQMTQHLFEGLDPALRAQLGGDTALVVSANFGSGNRGSMCWAMSASGIRFLVGKSFARIFYRNCINLGLPAVIAPEVVNAASPGSMVELDLDAGTVTVDGQVFSVHPIPSFLQELFAAGGLVPGYERDLPLLDATTPVG